MGAYARQHVCTGQPLGSQRFVAEAERVTRRPLHPLVLGRPRKEEK
jgi:hypothetical protein